MNSFKPIFVLIATLFLMSCQTGENKKLAPPNIVLLIAEDISPELGAYGNQYATTPNIDELASNGVVYDFALTTAPICAPSRST
ncbi:MAG: sulfatase-like hydrolase/transferase, partial [Bacteroidota bacterium]